MGYIPMGAGLSLMEHVSVLEHNSGVGVRVVLTDGSEGKRLSELSVGSSSTHPLELAIHIRELSGV